MNMATSLGVGLWLLSARTLRGCTQALPSPVVIYNPQAQIQVGDNIPISQTEVILEGVPRINPGGPVCMDIQQQVSNVDSSSVTAGQTNPSISTRSVSTQVVVQSGQIVLPGGLIKQDNAESNTLDAVSGQHPRLALVVQHHQHIQGAHQTDRGDHPSAITSSSRGRAPMTIISRCNCSKPAIQTRLARESLE